MKRLLPGTLFGRLVLVLLTGLFAAQLLGAVILLHDRLTLLYETGGLNAVHRIADIVRVLDTLGPKEGRLILPAVNTAMLHVAFTETPPSNQPSPQEEGLHAAHLRAILQRDLGTKRPLRVAVTQINRHPRNHHPSGFMHPPGPPLQHWPMFGEAAGSGVAFFVQTQLRDGRWVSFEQRLPQDQFAWPLRLLLALGILLVSVVLLSLLAVRWVTRPLTFMANAATELGRDINRAPLPESGPQEIRRAAGAFNNMQTRLLRFLQDREQMLTAVSHDLRTPLTRLRLRAEMLDDTELKTKVLHDLHDMEMMVNAALEFMRDTSRVEPIQPLDVNALLESIQADMMEMGHAVEINGSARQPLPARSGTLKRCLANLIENAVKYGERATVTIEDDEQQLRVTVADTGPGIPEEQLEKVFEPFYRADSARGGATGMGLGLSIARHIARTHGGDLILRNRPGGGLEAVLTLPRGLD